MLHGVILRAMAWDGQKNLHYPLQNLPQSHGGGDALMKHCGAQQGNGGGAGSPKLTNSKWLWKRRLTAYI